MELASISEDAEDINRICEAVQNFLETNKDTKQQEYVYLSLQKIFKNIGAKNPIFKNLMSLVKSVRISVWLIFFLINSM